VNHPFDLSLTTLKTLDLEFEELLSSHEATQMNGALSATTYRTGEEGGWQPKPPSGWPRPICPDDPPIATTKALGEEGGWDPPTVTTLALGEEGGHYSDPL
jgi:hypothetical protein